MVEVNLTPRFDVKIESVYLVKNVLKINSYIDEIYLITPQPT